MNLATLDLIPLILFFKKWRCLKNPYLGWMTLAIQYGRQYRTLLFLPLGSIKHEIFTFSDVTQFCPNLDHVISYSLRADPRICWTKWKNVQCMLVNFFARKAAWLKFMQVVPILWSVSQKRGHLQIFTNSVEFRSYSWQIWNQLTFYELSVVYWQPVMWLLYTLHGYVVTCKLVLDGKI